MLLAHWNEGGRQGWTLPGGGIDPGEAPMDAVVRELLEETGFEVEPGGLLGVDSIVIPAESRIGSRSEALHAIRIVYRARIVGGELRNELDGTTDQAVGSTPAEIDRLDRVPLVDVGRRFAGLQ